MDSVEMTCEDCGDSYMEVGALTEEDTPRCDDCTMRYCYPDSVCVAYFHPDWVDDYSDDGEEPLYAVEINNETGDFIVEQWLKERIKWLEKDTELTNEINEEFPKLCGAMKTVLAEYLADPEPENFH